MPESMTASAALERVRSYHSVLASIRRDIHAHPELGLATHRTADIVANLLKSWGIEVHRLVDGAGCGWRATLRQWPAIAWAACRHGCFADP